MAFCTNCGAKIDGGAAFCTSCGTPLAAEAKPAKSAAAKTASAPAASRQSGGRAASKTAPEAAQVAYQQPIVPAAEQGAVMSMLAWVGVLLLPIIPIVGLVVYLVWAFGSGSNPNLRNYTRAALLLMAIAIVLGLIMSSTMIALIGSLARF